MIYIGLVTLLTLIGLSVYHLKNSERTEKAFIKSLNGVLFTLKSDIEPQSLLSGLSNSVHIAGRLWTIKTRHKLHAGEQVKVTSAQSGTINIERVNNVTALKQVA